MSVGGDGTGEGATRFWICEKCCEACDPGYIEDTIDNIVERFTPLKELAQIEANKALKTTLLHRPFTKDEVEEFRRKLCTMTDEELREVLFRQNNKDDLIPETSPILE